jgi:hypothetical protein
MIRASEEPTRGVAASLAPATTLRRGQSSTEGSYVKPLCPSVFTSYSKVQFPTTFLYHESQMINHKPS